MEDPIPPPPVDDQVLAIVRSLRGVVRADFLTSADREALRGHATSSAADNRGIREVLGRERVLCLFKDAAFRPPPEPTLLLVDAAGKILGREVVTDEDRRASTERRLAFLGKDFVLSPGVRPAGTMHFLLPPVRFPELESVPGAARVVSASPDPPQDEYLRERLGVPRRNNLASILVGYDRGKP